MDQFITRYMSTETLCTMTDDEDGELASLARAELDRRRRGVFEDLDSAIRDAVARAAPYMKLHIQLSASVHGLGPLSREYRTGDPEP